MLIDDVDGGRGEFSDGDDDEDTGLELVYS